MPAYRVAEVATRIPVPGGKLIEEYFGLVSTKTEEFSLAHMVAPAGWSEPPQTPEFGELTIVIRGALEIWVDGDKIALSAGQALWVEPGATVHYSNPYGDESEYYAVCIPAFHPDRAHRHDE
ncbi:MAG: cupin domain-containing protein [Proteobacteria bacterium]|nr:cupin domain-containing protein [Pseudomonadota bacterium]